MSINLMRTAGYACALMALHLALAPPAAAQSVPPRGESLIFLGAEASAASSPRPSGFAAVALPVGQGTWSWSMYQLYWSAGKPVTATSTGLAKSLWCAKLGGVDACVIGLGTVGAATSGTAVTGAFTGGGGVNLKGLFKPWPSVSLFLGGVQSKAGSSSPSLALIAIGRSW